MILREKRMIKERYSTIIPIARNIYNTGHLMRSDAIVARSNESVK